MASEHWLLCCLPGHSRYQRLSCAFAPDLQTGEESLAAREAAHCCFPCVRRLTRLLTSVLSGTCDGHEGTRRSLLPPSKGECHLCHAPPACVLPLVLLESGLRHPLPGLHQGGVRHQCPSRADRLDLCGGSRSSPAPCTDSPAGREPGANTTLCDLREGNKSAWAEQLHLPLGFVRGSSPFHGAAPRSPSSQSSEEATIARAHPAAKQPVTGELDPSCSAGSQSRPRSWRRSEMGQGLAAGGDPWAAHPFFCPWCLGASLTWWWVQVH